MLASVQKQTFGEAAAALRELAHATRAQTEAVREQAQAAQEQAQAAREQAQAAREQAQAARDAAREQAQAARDEARDRAQAAREQAGGDGNAVVVTVTKDGKTVTIEDASPQVIYTALGMPAPDHDRHESDGPFVVGGLAIVSTAIVVLASVIMWYRAKMRGPGAAAGPANAELVQRMARMETAIESVAIEVERISEGQRFTARLLSERAPVEVPRG